jgi:phenylacetate-CoA ligase
MSSFFNPIFLSKIAKSYFTDVNRIWKMDKQQLEKYQDKCFKKVIKYAFTVPLYHKKYKEAGITSNDIRGLKDIKKLPIISKEEMKNSFPNGIVPPGFDKERNQLLSTSGSIGKPVFIYYDKFTSIKTLLGYVRALKEFGGIWNKSKIALVIDNKPGTIENTLFSTSISPFLKRFISLDNIKIFYVGNKTEEIIKDLNKFSPEFIGSDPVMFKELAYLKNNGLGENLNPECLFSSSAMLDIYTRKYVEKSFGVHLFDVYATTEAGLIAFECSKCNLYHVNSDFVFTEFIDKNSDYVGYDNPGDIIITRLYGTGTPIIRYSGLEDIVTAVETDCNCGIHAQTIKYIGGRSIDQILLPNGKTIAPFHVTTIPTSVMDDFKSYKLKQFQIIQHKIDDVEVLITIDERLKDTEPSVDKISKEIKKRFQEKIGQGVNIRVNEIDEIEKGVRSDYVKLVVSKIKSKSNNNN